MLPRRPNRGRPLPRNSPGMVMVSTRSHAHRAAVEIEQRLLLLHCGRFLAPLADQRAERRAVEAGGFCLGENVLAVGGARPLFLLHTLDALHDGAQPVSSDAARHPRRIVGIGLSRVHQHGILPCSAAR